MAYKSKSHWNYRILAHAPSEIQVKQGDTEPYLQMHEVYYKEGKPNSYTEEPITIGSETRKGIKWSLKQMKRALKKPILWHGDKFPQKYKPK